MTDTRRQLDHLLDAALDLPTEALPGFLKDRCPTHLRERLAALLEIKDDETRIEERSPFSGELFQELAFRLAEPLPELTEGERLGEWRVTGAVGHGGMGDVYRVESEDGGVAALKVSRKVGEPVAKHFRLERDVLDAVDHPNVVRLLDAGAHADGRPFVVLELVPGDHLDTHCDTRQLSVEERLRLFLQVGEAVQAVHEQGAVHRDLKPSNVLVTDDGHVKLIDFGIAKWTAGSGRNGGAETVAPGVEAMTPDCASPEQFLGRSVTAATDVYQLGVLLYTLLTGERPYALDNPNPAAMKKVVCEEEPRRPSDVFAGAAAWDAGVRQQADGRSASVPDLCRTLKGELDAIVLKALRKDPSRRHPTVGKLLTEIESYLGDRPTTVRRAA